MINIFGWKSKALMKAEARIAELKEAHTKLVEASQNLLAQRDEARKDAYELGKQLTTATKKITELLEQVRLMSQR